MSFLREFLLGTQAAKDVDDLAERTAEQLEREVRKAFEGLARQEPNYKRKPRKPARYRPDGPQDPYR